MADIMDFFAPVIRPDEVLPKHLKKVNVAEADKAYAIIGGISGLLIGLFIAFVGVIGSAFGAAAGLNQLAALSAGLGLAAIIVFPIIFAILSVVFGRIGSWIQAKFTRLFNGTGSFENTYYLMSKLLWPMLVINIVLNILSGIPVIGTLLLWAWILYSVYLTCSVLSIANKVNKWQALGAIIISVIVVTIVVIILMIALVGAIFSAVGVPGA